MSVEAVMGDKDAKPTIARSVGLFFGHIWRGVTADPAKREVRREVEEQVHEKDDTTVIARRTTIEEIEVRPKRSNETEQNA